LPSSEKALIRAKDAEIEELKKRLQGLAGSVIGAAGAEKDDQVAEVRVTPRQVGIHWACMKEILTIQLAESVADLEERKKRLTVQLAKLNGEILTSELPRLNGMVPMSPAKPKRRRISEFLGHDRPKTPASNRRAVSGRPPPITLDTTLQPKVSPP
jgi:centromeric protein E